MDKSKFYLNLSKCTEEEHNHIFSLLPTDKITAQIYYMIRNSVWEVLKAFSHLFFNENSLWQLSTETNGKTELTYPEFIKLFEGGESDGWIKIKNEKDLPKEDILYWVVKNGEVVDMENWELTLNFHNKRGVTHYQPIQKPEPPKF